MSVSMPVPILMVVIMIMPVAMSSPHKLLPPTQLHCHQQRRRRDQQAGSVVEHVVHAPVVVNQAREYRREAAQGNPLEGQDIPSIDPWLSGSTMSSAAAVKIGWSLYRKSPSSATSVVNCHPSP